MKATGIVRRIDELGRIVIPKEIRRNLGIKANEQLEIFVDNDSIILKKFSDFTNLGKIANFLVEIMGSSFDKNIMISDRSKVLAASSKYKKDYVGEALSSYVEDIMNDRKKVIESSLSRVEFINNTEIVTSYIIAPIIVNSDILGAIFLLNDKVSVSEEDEKVVNFIVDFLEKIVEE